MKEKTVYISKTVDANGCANYTNEENQVWEYLINRQMPVVEKYACPEYLEGLRLLNLPKNRVPECPEISSVLTKLTGWRLEPVPALISANHFFTLLANRQFPAATFIRTKEDIDYLEEPDIFHEIFGHCPLLTNQAYADFTQTYGMLGLKANEADCDLLARLYWFTVEFGLINSKGGLKAYGGGILSSKNETIYCIDSDVPQRKPFTALDALRTPYRIDIMQPVYFVIEQFEDLFKLIDLDLVALIQEARNLGEFPPNFTAAPAKEVLNSGLCC